MIISKIDFPIYGLILLLSILVGFLYIFLSLKKEKYKDKNIYLFYILALIMIVFLANTYTQITENTTKMFAGLSSYGAALGLIFSAIIYEKISPSNNRITKYSILALPLIYGISKIACFIVGCCYGIPYSGPFHIIYKDGLNIPLFPVQIVETISFIILFLILNKYKSNKNIIYITIILSAILKFLLDFLRYIHIEKLITANQIFSIVMIVITVVIYILKEKKYEQSKKRTKKRY